MWVFTKTGMISAVVQRDNPKLVRLRSRSLSQLQDFVAPLRIDNEIMELKVSDYRYAIVTSRNNLALLMIEAVKAMDYDNFKNSINKHEYHDACSRVWQVLWNAKEHMDSEERETEGT